MELLRQVQDALRGVSIRQMVEAAEETQIFAAGKPGIEAEVAAGMIAKLAANGARVENGIVPRDLCAALRRKKQCGKNTEERGFAGSICSQQGQRFAWPHFERHPGQGDDRRFFERLQKGAPAAARGRKRLLEIFDANRGFGHNETYSVSLARRQSAREEKQPAPNRGLLSLHGQWLNSPVE